MRLEESGEPFSHHLRETASVIYGFSSSRTGRADGKDCSGEFDFSLRAMNIAKRSISGWIACFDGVKFKGGICATGAENPGDVKERTTLLKKVYAMGSKV